MMNRYEFPRGSAAWTVLWVVGAVLAISLITVAASSCGADPSGYQVNQNVSPYTACETDDDCPVPGEVCSPHRVCLPRSAGEAPFAIELAPSESPDLLDRRLAPYELSSQELTVVPDGVTRVVYPEAVSLTGSVMVVNDAQVPLQATMTVSRPSRIPGRPAVMTAQTITAEGFLLAPRPEDVDPAFTVWVPSEEPLTIRAKPVAPFDQAYHPLRRDVVLGADSVESFIFGDPETSIHVAGALEDALGTPVQGVEVTAVDEEEGLYQSSVGVTDETGFFHLVLPRGLRAYRLLIRSDDPDRPMPSFVAEGIEIGAMADVQGAANSYDNPEILLPLRLPPYPITVPVTIQLQGRSSDGSLVPIRGAQVTLESDFGDPESVWGTYLASGTSDDEGQVDVVLLPGDSVGNRAYRVTLITPVDSGSEFASDVMEGDRALQMGMTGGVVTLELTRRLPVSSTILSERLGPLAGMTVQAKRLDGPEDLRDMLRSVSTDDTGRFSLKLGPGSYRVEVVPPSGLPLAPWVLADLWTVGETDVPIFDNGLTAPDPEVLELEVVSSSPEHTPLPYVRVTLYQVDEYCAALNPTDFALCDRAPAYLGDAVTDGAGHIRFLVPAP